MTLHGQRLVITSAGRLGLATARAAIAAGARVHLIDASSRALARAKEELEVTTGAADVLQPGPAVAAFMQAYRVLGGIDGVVTIVEEPVGAGATGAGVDAAAVRQVLEMHDAPRALVFAEAVTRAHREASERGAVMVASTLLQAPEEGPTTHCYAFATVPLDLAAQPAGRRHLDYGPRVMAMSLDPARERVAARTARTAWQRGSGGDWLGETEQLDLPAELVLDVDEITTTCLWLLGGHRKTAELLGLASEASLS